MTEAEEPSTAPNSEATSLPQSNRRIAGAPQRYVKIMTQFLAHRGTPGNYSLTEMAAGAIGDDVLVAITPEEVKEFLCDKAYGHRDPGPHDFPTSCRANTLVVYKKAISWFLPRQAHPWDEVGRVGNPTRSPLVNSVVKKVQKYEVRKQGADSQCRRPIEYQEYIQILDLLKQTCHSQESSTMVKNKILKTLSLITLQWHTISRVDDMCHFRYSDITSNPSFSFALSCQLRWSKNIMEERDSPQQIVLGAMDPRVCPMMNLIHYIEYSNRSNLLQEGEFLFGGKGTSEQVRKQLMVLFGDPTFKQLGTGLLGTHSFRKGPATYASRCGLSRDVISRRGRWKGGKQMVDTYIDINLPVPDAMAASKLCGPDGACKYVLKKNNISKEWLVQQVASGAGTVFSRSMAETLSLPLLWAAFEDYRVEKGGGEEANNYIPILSETLKQELLEAYCREYGALPAEFQNPVCKVPILPQGFGAQLHMVELHSTGTDPPEDGAEADGDQVPGTGRRAPAGGAPILSQSVNHPEAATALLSQQVQVQRRVEENAMDIKNELTRVAHSFTRQFHNIHRAIKRIALQPVLRPRRRAEIVDTILRNSVSEEELVQNLELPFYENSRAQLYKGVKNLHDLWHEYEFGLAGNKAARHFTSTERGKCRFMYSRRKVFWDVVQKMINAGYTSDLAVDKVYLVYGRSLAVTYILQKMAEDRKTGGHPELQ